MALKNPFSTLVRFVKKTFVIAELEVRKLRHDPSDLVIRIFGLTYTQLLWMIGITNSVSG